MIDVLLHLCNVETKNNWILITGAANGIGRATARQLCLQGYQVLALSRNEAKLHQLKAEAGENLYPIPFDLQSGNFSELTEVLKKLGVTSLKGIIHNAGVLVNKPFEEMQLSDLRDSYETNVFAPYLLTQSLLPLLKISTPSHVVMVSSVGGIQGSVKFPGLTAYSSSKGALCVLTECLALELANTGISVNCLALGAVQTEMLSQAFPGYNAPMQPVDMASMISWFIIEGNRFFNGKILPVANSTP